MDTWRGDLIENLKALDTPDEKLLQALMQEACRELAWLTVNAVDTTPCTPTDKIVQSHSQWKVHKDTYQHLCDLEVLTQQRQRQLNADVELESPVFLRETVEPWLMRDKSKFFPMLKVPLMPDGSSDLQSFIAHDKIHIDPTVAESLRWMDHWKQPSKAKATCLKQSMQTLARIPVMNNERPYTPLLPPQIALLNSSSANDFENKNTDRDYDIGSRGAARTVCSVPSSSNPVSYDRSDFRWISDLRDPPPNADVRICSQKRNRLSQPLSENSCLGTGVCPMRNAAKGGHDASSRATTFSNKHPVLRSTRNTALFAADSLSAGPASSTDIPAGTASRLFRGRRQFSAERNVGDFVVIRSVAERSNGSGNTDPSKRRQPFEVKDPSL